jgi:hypothetical protein
MTKSKFIILLFVTIFTLTNSWSQKTKEYYFTDIQAFDENDNKMKLTNKMREKLGVHFFITELENNLIVSSDKNHKKDKEVFQKKESNITNTIYYFEKNTSSSEVTVYSILFSSKIKIEMINKWSKVKKIIVSAEKI